MATRINIESLDLGNAMEAVGQMKALDDKEVLLDFEHMYSVRSVGMIYLVTAIEEMRRRGWSFNYEPNRDYWNDPRGISYAGTVGFFDALGIKKGETMGTYKGSSTYCPILRVSIKDLYKDSSIIQESIEKEAQRLASVLTQDVPVATKAVGYLIREIMRNTFEHTDMDHLWIAAQRHDTEKKIEVAIADNSVGIKQVIRVNALLREKITDDITALRYAVKPGISGNARTSTNTSYWANSGYGLYVTAELMKRVGFFGLISGNGYLYRSDERSGEIETVDFQGTMVYLKIDMNKLDKMTPGLINDIVNIGQQDARSDDSAVKVASKASQIVF